MGVAIVLKNTVRSDGYVRGTGATRPPLPLEGRARVGVAPGAGGVVGYSVVPVEASGHPVGWDCSLSPSSSH